MYGHMPKDQIPQPNRMGRTDPKCLLNDGRIMMALNENDGPKPTTANIYIYDTRLGLSVKGKRGHSTFSGRRQDLPGRHR